MSAPRSLPPPAKKRKLSKDDDSDDVIASIAQLEKECVESVDKLAELLQLTVKSTNVQYCSKGIFALYRVFLTLIGQGALGDAEKKKTIWGSLNPYTDFVGSLLKDNEVVLQKSAVQILFSIQKHLSTASSKTNPEFHLNHFRKIVTSLLLCLPSSRPKSPKQKDRLLEKDVLETFSTNYFCAYVDIRWFFLREASFVLSSSEPGKQSTIASNLLSILERLTSFPTSEKDLDKFWVVEFSPKPAKSKKGSSESAPDDEDEDAEKAEDEDDWRTFFDSDVPSKAPSSASSGPRSRLHTLTIHQSLHTLQSHKALFTRVWTVLLPYIRTKKERTKVLEILHANVLPNLTRPVMVMDWVGECVDFGGTIGLLALNALYTLLKEYNLDYPQFYTRLYSFLDASLLHLKYRDRFFRLIEVFLSSTLLPATLLASFLKRLSRFSLSAPPSAIVTIVPFTYNLMKRHPKLMVMIHRGPVLPGTDYAEIDPFDPAEPNPLLTNALLSSLWELATHQRHYHPSVSTLARVFAEPFTRQSWSMEAFLDTSYASLMQAETNRKIKKEPALSMELQLASKTNSKKEWSERERRWAETFGVFAVGDDNEESDGDEEEDMDVGMRGEGSGGVVAQLWSFS